MKTKRIVILFLAVFAIGTAYGQQKWIEQVDRLEALSLSKPDNSIRVNSSIQKTKDGSIIRLSKSIALINRPDLVPQLTEAFEQEEGKAERTRIETSNMETVDNGTQTEQKRTNRYLSFKDEKDNRIYFSLSL